MKITPQFMLDTNICIYIQRHKPPSVLEQFEKLKPGQAVISVITWGEMLYGAAKSQDPKRVLKLLEEFASLVPVLAMQPECGKVYGQIRTDLEKRGQPIGNNDLWIAAHAMAAELPLVTNNTKEFERIPHLKVENWI
ncbi:MAG: type II toxin-antitoxin system VapC family toxin [Deltaproteobacteria bacterium]|jgi:tRNA(fMet)-specific endonuclease VapC|nr:type II toxin-antitoxin system VapC family toxin [Deltaproteobacteria bacterium]